MKQLLLLLVSATGLFAADASGTWEGTLKAPDHEGPAYLILSQQGDTLTGSGGPTADKQHPISNGKAKDGVITFEVQEDDGVMRFSLKQEGDVIKGAVTRERDGEKLSGELYVKRVKPAAEDLLVRTEAPKNAAPKNAASKPASGRFTGRAGEHS